MASSCLSGLLIKTLKCYTLSALLASGVLLIMTFFINSITAYFVGGALLLTPYLERFARLWIPKERVTPNGKAVFISGCDRGFGYMLALRLDDIGFHVFAGCLFPDGDGAANLRKAGSERLHVISLDVTSDSSVAEAATYVHKNLNGNVLWAVVNNAGVAISGEVHWLTMETIENVTDVNLLGVIRVTKAFISKLKESKGRIITVASSAGRNVAPGIVPYCLGKAAVISFCDGLRLELYKWGIQVITIEPFFYRTDIIRKEEITGSIKRNWEKASKDVKDMYDSKYLDAFTKKMLIFCRNNARDPNEVISVMEEAILDSYPEYSYAPGSYVLHWGSWFIRMLPRPVGDMLTLFYILGKDLM